MPLSQRDTDHVFQCLRGGTVPERGLETFAARALSASVASCTGCWSSREAAKARASSSGEATAAEKTFLARLTAVDAAT
jgi:hypothetical protein